MNNQTAFGHSSDFFSDSDSESSGFKNEELMRNHVLKHNTTLFHSRRPTILYHRSTWISILYRFLNTFLFLFEFTLDQQTLKIRSLENIHDDNVCLGFLHSTHCFVSFNWRYLDGSNDSRVHFPLTRIIQTSTLSARLCGKDTIRCALYWVALFNVLLVPANCPCGNRMDDCVDDDDRVDLHAPLLSSSLQQHRAAAN